MLPSISRSFVLIIIPANRRGLVSNLIRGLFPKNRVSSCLSRSSSSSSRGRGVIAVNSSRETGVKGRPEPEGSFFNGPCPLMSFIGQFPNHLGVQILNEGPNLIAVFFIIKFFAHHFGGDGDNNSHHFPPEFFPSPAPFSSCFATGPGQDLPGLRFGLPDDLLFLL